MEHLKAGESLASIINTYDMLEEHMLAVGTESGITYTQSPWYESTSLSLLFLRPPGNRDDDSISLFAIKIKGIGLIDGEVVVVVFQVSEQHTCLLLI
jgi:hypothetical protein